jgi:hypothetical protein
VIQATTKAKIEMLKVKAEAVHIAALHLSNTLGIFHGINNSFDGGLLGGPEIRAINVIQSDLLHLLVIRVCALCTSAQNRPDDASIMGLIDALQDQEIRQGLIDADKRWRAAIGYRAERCTNVQKSIGMLKRRWSPISSQPEVLERLRHFRNKRLGHVTVAAKPNQEAQLIELWRMARKALSAARQIRLVFHREDFNYLQSSSRAEVVGRKLIIAIKPRTAK